MLKINWALGYANNPSLILEESLDLLPREECEFQFQNGIWWHIQDNGLVRYFAHSGSDQNEGGFGGSAFEFLYKGQPRRVVGPWSSRAAYLNTVLPEDQQVADITLDNGKQHRIHVGILVLKLLEYWDVEAYCLRSVSKNTEGYQEHGPITASLAPDCILKPDGMRYDPADNYQIFKEPVK